MLKLKHTHKYKTYGYFTPVTAGIILVFLFISLCTNLAQSYNKLQSNQATILSKLTNILKVKDIDVDLSFQEIKDILDESVNPVFNTFGLDVKQDQNLNRLYGYFRVFVKDAKPLLEYKFSKNGITNDFNPKANFTDDLDAFFQNTDNIVAEMKKSWNNIWYYKMWTVLINNSRINTILDEIDDFFNIYEYLSANKTNLLSILGHYSSRKIVIFNQNTGEARPTGGFIGSYIPIEILKGRVNIGQSQSIYYISGSQNSPRLTHPANWYYPYSDTDNYSGIYNTNYFPCFNDTASYLEDEFARSGNGYSLDGIIMITPQFVKNLLPPNFVVQVTDDLIISSENLLEEIERITSIEAVNPENPKQDIGLIFNKIIDHLPDIIKLTGLNNFLGNILSTILSRELQVWFKQPPENSLFNKLFINSINVCTDTKALIPLISNISGDKRNLITSNQYSIYTENNFDSRTVHVVYKQDIPPQPLLQRGFNYSAPFSFVGMQLPDNAYSVEVSSDSAANVPGKRDFYQQQVELITGQTLQVPDKMQVVVNTLRNYGGNDTGSSGFHYLQANGSTVAGIYIADHQVSRVEFKFKLPLTDTAVNFYGQPGMNKPSLSLGDGVYFSDNSNARFTYNSDIIEQGSRLILR